MKIDGHHPAQDTQGADATRRTGKDGAVRHGAPASAPPASSDRVELSSDAALRTTALKAATDAPDVRADRVAKAREKLEAGTLGADATRLADAILDDLLK
jgi:flagellar biosynthesis anti-sigma factor FlgM